MAKINIPGRLHSVETGNIVTGADEVLDDNMGLNQQTINQQVDEAVTQLESSTAAMSERIEEVARMKDKSVGLYSTLASLQAAYPTPEVGDWALVGDSDPFAVYECSTAGTWSATGGTYSAGEIDLADYTTKAEFDSIEGIVSNNFPYTIIDPTANQQHTYDTRWRIEWYNVLVNGDILTITCQTGYEAYVGLVESEAWVKTYTDDYVSGKFTLNYEDGANTRLRVLIKKEDGTTISQQEVEANVEISAKRYTNLQEKLDSMKEAIRDVAMEVSGYNISPTDYELRDCSLGNTWYKVGGGQSHIAIPVTQGRMFKLTNNRADVPLFYAWLTSSYSPPYKNGETIPFSSYATSRLTIESLSSGNITAPSDAAYLCVNMVDGGGNKSDYQLLEIRYEETLSSRVEKLELGGFTGRIVDYASHASFDGYIRDNGTVLITGSTSVLTIVPVSLLRGKRIKVSPNQDNATLLYGFVQKLVPKKNNASVTYCDGENLRKSEYYGYIPNDCSFIFVSTLYKSEDVAPLIVIEDVAETRQFVAWEELDLTGYAQQDCSFGATYFYSTSSKAQKHIVIPVTPDQTYRIEAQKWEGFVAVFTSDYSAPYVTKDPLPLAGFSSQRITVTAGGYLNVVIPPDGAYLGLTLVDGAGKSPEFHVYRTTPVYNDCPHMDTPVKIRVVQWNVGHWAMGKSSTSTLNPTTYAEKRDKYLNAVNSMKADIISMCEWSHNVVNAGDGYDAIEAKKGLFGLYKRFSEGTQVGYMCTAQVSNLPMFDNAQTVYQHTIQSGRYFRTSVYHINGYEVKVVSTHLDFNQNEYGATYRREQMETLISTFANDPYVIICADYNVASSSEYDLFAENGYEMANHGYIGDIPTYSSDDVLDNIIAKGFQFSDVQIYDANLELSDHRALGATLTMIDYSTVFDNRRKVIVGQVKVGGGSSSAVDQKMIELSNELASIKARLAALENG